ncbi:hypothetical protein E2C01_013163 [Portunus trituberculatus]|uniref:Uncharacterized protein n=1 Tax=Portunus trituberculatus TaxID=210409 RepID=A0A5B7DGD1_PORTR|nr:hypothetical protein [Portunus trituberculatus]
MAQHHHHTQGTVHLWRRNNVNSSRFLWLTHDMTKGRSSLARAPSPSHIIHGTAARRHDRLSHVTRHLCKQTDERRGFDLQDSDANLDQRIRLDSGSKQSKRWVSQQRRSDSATMVMSETPRHSDSPPPEVCFPL